MAAPPPPFNTNVDLDASRQLELNVTAWLCTGVAIFTVAMKMFTKAQIVKIVGWDDFIILLSMTLSIIAASLVSSAVSQGLGRHTVAVLAEPDGRQRLVSATFKLQVGYSLHIGAFSFPNISIALLVVQLLDRNVGRAWALYGLVGLQAAAAVVSMAGVFVQCAPAEWRRESAGGAMPAMPVPPPAACWDAVVFNDFSYFVTAYTALTDVVLAGVPIAAFWRLQMPPRTRLGVCLLMGLTLLSAVVTVVKARYLHLFTDVEDPLWNTVPLVIWGLIEQNIVIVAACIPTVRPFFTRGVLLAHRSGAATPPLGGTWLDSWRANTPQTESERRRRWFLQGYGWKSRRCAPSPSHMPLRDMEGQACRHRWLPEIGDTTFPDDASQKGIMRTIAVAMQWESEEPPSMRSARTDSIVPPPLAAGFGGDLYEQRRALRLGDDTRGVTLCRVETLK